MKHLIRNFSLKSRHRTNWWKAWLLLCVASDGASFSVLLYIQRLWCLEAVDFVFFRKEEVKGASSCEMGRFFRENVLRSWNIGIDWAEYFFLQYKKREGLSIFLCVSSNRSLRNAIKMSKKIFLCFCTRTDSFKKFFDEKICY